MNKKTRTEMQLKYRQIIQMSNRKPSHITVEVNAQMNSLATSRWHIYILAFILAVSGQTKQMIALNLFETNKRIRIKYLHTAENKRQRNRYTNS